MIGTLLTVGTGVYVGLFLASKGCTYRAAVKPLREASDMIRSKCGCSSSTKCENEDNSETNECEKKEEKNHE